MTATTKMQRGLALRAYLLATHAIPLIAGPVLRRRLKRGKENPARWREKLGLGLAPRPDGPLVWLHAVGLGEVLSLRGLIAQMHDARPDLSFLVTSTTRASGDVFAKNLPPRTIHQFLPLDTPAYRRRFLDHFQPNLCLWVEQDLWPGFVSDIAARCIPQAVIAARMNARSHASHERARGVYRDLYRTMARVTAQDQATADHLTQLGARDVTVNGSLKPGAPPLAYDPVELARLQNTLARRRIWAVAPSHPADEAIALAAHATLREIDPDALLIIAPRDPDRRGAFPDDCPKRSLGAIPGPADPIWLCDTFGDLGLVYRLADTVLIGGTFSEIEGHNPWEAAALDTGILHGPHVANFATDYTVLNEAGGARCVTDAEGLAATLSDTIELAQNARQAAAKGAARTGDLAADLLTLLEN